MLINKWMKLGMAKKSHSATDEPWKHPGQNSQDSEQEARAKKSQWEKADPKKQ